MGSPLQTYLSQIADIALLTADEERDLATRVQAGDNEARERMITANLRLSISVAARYQGYGLGLEDLVEEGNLGLVEAVQRYDPERGTRFSTYAMFWIRQKILHALSQSTRLVRVPVHVQRRGDPLAAQTSLDAIDGDQPAVDCEVEETAIAAEERERLGVLLETLDERRRRIIEMRYGLGDEPGMTLREIARRVSLSRERVRQLTEDALRRMRGAVRDDRVAAVGTL